MLNVLPAKSAVLVTAALAKGAVGGAGGQQLATGARALGVALIATGVPRVEQLALMRTRSHKLTHSPSLTGTGPVVIHNMLID